MFYEVIVYTKLKKKRGTHLVYAILFNKTRIVSHALLLSDGHVGKPNTPDMEIEKKYLLNQRNLYQGKSDKETEAKAEA